MYTSANDPLNLIIITLQIPHRLEISILTALPAHILLPGPHLSRNQFSSISQSVDSAWRDQFPAICALVDISNSVINDVRENDLPELEPDSDLVN